MSEMSAVPEILRRIQKDLEGVPECVQDIINRHSQINIKAVKTRMMTSISSETFQNYEKRYII